MDITVNKYTDLIKAVKEKQKTIYVVGNAYKRVKRSYRYYEELTGKTPKRMPIIWMATGQEGSMAMNGYMDFRVKRLKTKMNNELKNYSIEIEKAKKIIILRRN